MTNVNFLSLTLAIIILTSHAQRMIHHHSKEGEKTNEEGIEHNVKEVKRGTKELPLFINQSFHSGMPQDFLSFVLDLCK